MKPRLNRLNGVSTVVVQGGQEPEFEVRPDPAKLLQTARHRSQHAGRDRTQQHDRFARADRRQSPAGAEPGQRAGAHRGTRSADIVIKTTPAGAPVRIGDVATVEASGEAGVHRRHRQRQARRAAQHLPPAGQQHRRGRRRGARGDRRGSGRTLPQGHRAAAVLRSVRNRQRLHQERARRDPDRAGPGVADHGAVPARLGHVAGRRPGDSGHASRSPSSCCASSARAST